MVGAEVMIERAVAQHVVDGSQDRGGDGADRLLWSATMTQALELGLEIAGLLSTGGPGALDECGLEPRRTLAQPSGPSLAGALVIAGA